MVLEFRSDVCLYGSKTAQVQALFLKKKLETTRFGKHTQVLAIFGSSQQHFVDLLYQTHEEKHEQWLVCFVEYTIKTQTFLDTRAKILSVLRFLSP